ncbi:MAG: choice-of-anchor J domain-containing protein [Flavobacteriales bacterium]|nr:choice-of-anchor J domain-containing protein [Flavobacteriales bacterium]
MQKRLQSLFLLVIALLSTSTLISQTIYSEDFNGANSLTNFTLIDNDGATPQVNYAFFTDAWITLTDVDSVGTMDSVAASTSWYTPARTADDYIITPQIILTNDNVFSFDARASDANFPDGYEVLISTTTPDTAGLNANPVLFSIPAGENAFWTRRSVDLSAYAGSTVYLAIRNNTTDRNILYVDNFLVEVGAKFDAAILGVQRLSEYSQIPLNQSTTPTVSAGAVRNLGSDTLTNVELKYTVFNSGLNVFSDSTTVSFIAPGDDSIFVDFSTFIPSLNGSYVVNYEVSSDSTDSDLSNNTVSSDTLTLTDFNFARDNGVATGALSVGAGAAANGELGSIYELGVSDTLTSVSVRIANATGNMTNQPLFANIRSIINGIPGVIIATSDTLIFPNVTNSFVDLTFNNAGGYVVLPADSFFVGIVEGDSSLTLATSAAKFVANTNFVTFGTTPWTPNENFNFIVTYMIRPTFGAPNLTVGIENQNSDVANLMVYPNPSNGVFNLLVTDRSTENNVDLKVIDAQGKTVIAKSLIGGRIIQEQIDLSAFEKGIYFIQLNTVQGVVNRKLILK